MKTEINLVHASAEPDGPRSGQRNAVPTVGDIIAQLEVCQAQDWRLDREINNILGCVRAISCLGLRGSGKRTRYFGPKSDPFGRGSPVPSPTKTPESRQRALKALIRQNAREKGDPA